MKLFNLFLQVVQKVEALGKLDMSVQSMGQTQAYLLQI